MKTHKRKENYYGTSENCRALHLDGKSRGAVDGRLLDREVAPIGHVDFRESLTVLVLVHQRGVRSAGKREARLVDVDLDPGAHRIDSVLRERRGGAVHEGQLAGVGHDDAPVARVSERNLCVVERQRAGAGNIKATVIGAGLSRNLHGKFAVALNRHGLGNRNSGVVCLRRIG